MEHKFDQQTEEALSLFAPTMQAELREKMAEDTEPETEQIEEQEEYKSDNVYSLRFYAENGKAIAEATFGDESHKIEVKSREHAMKIAKRAVAKANEDGAAIDFFHGFETDGVDPFSPQFARTCLSAEAYEVVWAELEAAKHNSLWKPSW